MSGFGTLCLLLSTHWWSVSQWHRALAGLWTSNWKGLLDSDLSAAVTGIQAILNCLKMYQALL